MQIQASMGTLIVFSEWFQLAIASKEKSLIRIHRVELRNFAY